MQKQISSIYTDVSVCVFPWNQTHDLGLVPVELDAHDVDMISKELKVNDLQPFILRNSTIYPFFPV